MRVFVSLLVLALALTPVDSRAKDAVSVAAAANLVFVIEDLNAAFRAEEPDTHLTVATGASGNLVAQITHGAPFDVFLSADTDYPQALIAAGVADAASFKIFAIGQLVLWTTHPVLLADAADADPATRIAALVRSPVVRKLAIAHSDTAPYGRAATQALATLGLWEAAHPKLVVGESISQTAQFVETGNADAGFVALSLVLSPKLKDRGAWLEVPAAWHEPLAHGAVLTSRGAKNPAAARYLAFLGSERARKIFQRYGYDVPSAD